MKRFIQFLLIAFLISGNAKADPWDPNPTVFSAKQTADTNFFPWGDNTGYYGSQFTDQQIYDLMYTAGARVARPFLSLQQWIQFGITPFAAKFNYPYQTKGMRNNVFTFHIASPFEGGGPYVGQSTFVTAGGNQSLLPASLDTPIFNIVGTDTTVNTNNLYAAYVASVYNATQGSFTYYEPYNEPDLNNDYVDAQYDSSMGYYNTWATYPPSPDQLINVYDSMKNIVRLYQITNQVIHFLSHHNPAIQVCAGGISLRYFWRQFLKAGVKPWIDNISIHNYPYYYWAYYTPLSPIGGGNARFSDMLLQVNDSVWSGIQVISTQNGVSANLPHCITETNEMRWNYDTYTYPADIGQINKFIGNDHVQRNYEMKMVADFWRKGFLPIVSYQTGDAEDSGVITSGDYHNAEGIYKNLDTTTSVANAAIVPSGTAMQTMQRVLGNYSNAVTAPGVTPTINPSTGTDGIQVDSAGVYALMLWTQTNVDSSETPKVLKTYNLGTTVYKEYAWNGYVGTATGVVTLSGDPLIFVPQTSAVANAGSNDTIILPLDSVQLNGSLSTGATSYSWTQTSGPNTATLRTPTAVTCFATNLIAGTYVFQLSINSGASTASVTIKVDPAPVANAGSNQTITLPLDSVTLNGTGSSGTIVSQTWTQTYGPGTATLRTPTALTTIATNLTAGTYIFQLSLNGGTSTSTVTITVNAAPVANAGPNQTIMLPKDSVTLTGALSTGATSYSWTQTSGPGTATIRTPTTVTTVATNLIQGTYVFNLSINSGASSANVTITVNPNTPPKFLCVIPGSKANHIIFVNGVRSLFASTWYNYFMPAPGCGNGGSTQVIQLPLDSCRFGHSATSGGCDIKGYGWTQVLGPSTAIIESPASDTTEFNKLVVGTYVFKLTVTDDCGQTASVTDTCIVENGGLPLPPPDTVITTKDNIEFELYPIPANTTITEKIGGNDDGEVLIKIINTMGRTVLTSQGRKNSFYYQVTFTLTALATGMYVSQTTIGGRQFVTQKFTIVR